MNWGVDTLAWNSEGGPETLLTVLMKPNISIPLELKEWIFFGHYKI